MRALLFGSLGKSLSVDWMATKILAWFGGEGEYFAYSLSMLILISACLLLIPLGIVKSIGRYACLAFLYLLSQSLYSLIANKSAERGQVVNLVQIVGISACAVASASISPPNANDVTFFWVQVGIVCFFVFVQLSLVEASVSAPANDHKIGSNANDLFMRNQPRGEALPGI